MQACGSRADAGFSVLEALISLVLLAFIMLLLPSSLKLATAIWSTGDRIEKNMAAAVLVEKVRLYLQEAREEFSRAADGNLHLLFHGDRTRLNFIALAQSGPAKSGLYTFQLEPIDSSETPGGFLFTQIVYRPERVPGTRDALRPSATRRLVNSRLSFAYYGPLQQGEAVAWQDEWRDRMYLPEMVALHLESVDSGSHHSRRLVVPLRLGKRSARAAP